MLAQTRRHIKDLCDEGAPNEQKKETLRQLFAIAEVYSLLRAVEGEQLIIAGDIAFQLAKDLKDPDLYKHAWDLFGAVNSSRYLGDYLDARWHMKELGFYLLSNELDIKIEYYSDPFKMFTFIFSSYSSYYIAEFQNKYGELNVLKNFHAALQLYNETYPEDCLSSCEDARSRFVNKLLEFRPKCTSDEGIAWVENALKWVYSFTGDSVPPREASVLRAGAGAGGSDVAYGEECYS